MGLNRVYPIGVQTFSDIIDRKCFYVDKTEYVYNLTHTYKYVFLSRPRRFGKSLLISTIKEYYEGNKELFSGLAISKLEKNWVKHPVFRFDMSTAKSMVVNEIENTIGRMLSDYEAIYGVDYEGGSVGDRLRSLIQRAYTQTGQKVILLIDEYDAPVLNVLHNEKVLVEVRDLVRSFFSPIKSSDEYLEFGFLTGITKFSQLSIFSEINNLKDISMLPEYCALCGVTENELLTQCKSEVEYMAEKFECSCDEMIQILKDNYDGYHFSEESDGIYNPFSLINAFSDSKIGQYWFASATPSFLLRQMERFNTDLLDLDGRSASRSNFDISPELADNALPLLYQTGYLTIKDYTPKYEKYTLGFPNKEVRIGFLENLLPTVTKKSTETNATLLMDVASALDEDKLDVALTKIKNYIATIPNTVNNKTEKDYQTIMYLIFSLLGRYMEVEVPSAIGRMDAVVKADNTIYIFEYKLDKTAREAMAQINDRRYADRYILDNRKKVKVGINFSSELRTIESWVVE